MRSRLNQPAGKILIGLVLCAFLALAGRLVYINAHDGPGLAARAARQQRSTIPIKHRRGLIVDCRGRLISGTMLRQSVFADPSVIGDKQHATQVVAEILGLVPDEIAPDLLAAGDRRFFVIQRGVSDSEAERIRAAGIYGLGLFDEPYRVYPMSSLAAAVVGFVSPDGRGVSGLEHQCESWLGGDNGIKTIVRDARRKAFWLADGGYRPARDGFHVVLTLDAEIQAVVERELAACVKRFNAESAIGIVMHAKSGAVLAMANHPGFDPNHYRDYSISRYRNRAITDPYEPGSTFKPFVAAAALAEGVVRMGEVFDCEMGSWKDGPRTLHDHHPFGRLTFEEVLIRSSNIAMGKIGKRLGNELLYQYVKAYRFGEKTGIDLEGEDAGLLPPLVRWTSYTTTSIPMGQEIAVTPIQLARAFSAFANGGQLVRPHVIRAVMAPDGRVVRDFSNPPFDGEAIPAGVANTMKDKILFQVVEAKKDVRLQNYRVFGKTGTAQIARRDGRGYETNAYVSSFIAGAPLSDPELIVLVTVRRPDKALGYYGGTVAAPTAREILRNTLAYLQITPDRPGASDLSVSAATAEWE